MLVDWTPKVMVAGHTHRVRERGRGRSSPLVTAVYLPGPELYTYTSVVACVSLSVLLLHKETLANMELCSIFPRSRC